LEEKKKWEEEKKLKPEKDSFLKSGYSIVYFQNNDAIEKFKNSTVSDYEGKTEKSGLRGLEYWTDIYNQKVNADPAELQQSIDKYMFEFDKREIEHRNKLDELTSIPDKDGWITVTNKGRKKNISGIGKIGTTNLSQETLMEMKKEKDKKMFKNDFYKFQRAEKQKKALDQLRKKI